MQNRILWLLISILLLYLLFSKNGIQVIKNLIANATTSTSSSSTGFQVNPKYGTVNPDGSVSGNLSGGADTTGQSGTQGSSPFVGGSASVWG